MKITDKEFQTVIEEMEKQGLQMDTIMIHQSGHSFSYVFPNGTQRKNIRSISKPILALCVGKAIEEGIFPDGINESVFKYFEDRTISNANNIEFLKKLKIRHLITLTLGHEERTMNSDQMKNLKGQDLVDFILNFPILHDPGDHFLYTNPPAYLMSYILHKATGEKVLDYAREKIFNPLEIGEVTWKESEQGYNMGCTGVEISANDLLKIGQLILNDGVFNGVRVINSEWVSNMKKRQVLTPLMYDASRVLPKYAYGYNLWICENGNCYCDGTDGQYLIIVPEKEMVIVTMGYQSNMKPITECMRHIILD